MAAENFWNPNKFGKGKGGWESRKTTSDSEVQDAISAERLGDVTGLADKAKKMKEESKETKPMKDPNDCSGLSGLALAACTNRKKKAK